MGATKRPTADERVERGELDAELWTGSLLLALAGVGFAATGSFPSS